MKILGNGRLFTRGDGNKYFENGAVAFDEGKIVCVGSNEDVKAKYKDAEFIDAKGGVIMPAFINMHEHIYSAFARGFSIKGYNPKGFLDILDGQWWTIDRHLTNDNNYYSAMATYMDSIKNGVTTTFDHHASFGEIKDSLFAIGDACKEVGIRSCMCYEISDRDGLDKAKEAVLENEAWAKHALADDSDMIAGMIGMHAQFTISDETFNMAYQSINKDFIPPDFFVYHIPIQKFLNLLQSRNYILICKNKIPTNQKFISILGEIKSTRKSAPKNTKQREDYIKFVQQIINLKTGDLWY